MDRRLLLIGMGALVALLIVTPFTSATDPFGNTFIVKKDSRWACPRRFTCDLVVVNQDRNTRQRLTLDQMFPGRDQDVHVALTTAGPLWGEASLYYIVRLNEVDYFTMHMWTGKRLLVNLETVAIEDPTPLADSLREADKREIRSTLVAATQALAKGEGFDEEKFQGATILAAKYQMREVRKELEEIDEKGDWHGPTCWHANLPSTKALASGPQSLSFKVLTDRRSAQLCLRRMGFSPQGYPQIVFEGDKQERVIAPEQRVRHSQTLAVGMTVEQVYHLLGSPDYLAASSRTDIGTSSTAGETEWRDGWRYDIDTTPDYSLLIIWNNEAKVDRIEKVTPALWHGDDLFSDEAAKPMFRPDGDVNAIHLYSKTYQGRIEDISQRKAPLRHVPERR